MLTLAILTLPSYSPASSSSTGAIILQGPHHSAQKSTTTGVVDLRTSSEKFPSVKVTTFAAAILPLPLLQKLLQRPIQSPRAIEERKQARDGAKTDNHGNDGQDCIERTDRPRRSRLRGGRCRHFRRGRSGWTC